tara:strand:- start:1658 stop:1870 length:213 start_codon:yes stop_codon:yes gene_type:complete
LIGSPLFKKKNLLLKFVLKPFNYSLNVRLFFKKIIGMPNSKSLFYPSKSDEKRIIHQGKKFFVDAETQNM